MMFTKIPNNSFITSIVAIKRQRAERRQKVLEVVSIVVVECDEGNTDKAVFGLGLVISPARGDAGLFGNEDGVLYK